MRKGYSIWGNDVSKYAVNEMRKKGIKAEVGVLGKGALSKNKFDVVTAWDVLEHLPNIKQAAEEISESLKPGGHFFFTTPNTESWDARLAGEGWYGYKKIPEHVLYFNKLSVRVLMEEVGLEVIEILQWGFERDWNFIGERVVGYFPKLRGVWNRVKYANWVKKSVFLPVIDFLIVARKK